MSDVCLNCGGLIGEIGKTYGYAGKWCHCQQLVQIQRPASKETVPVILKRRDVCPICNRSETYIKLLESECQAARAYIDNVEDKQHLILKLEYDKARVACGAFREAKC